ncbi:MAG: DUF177 domain-containing protein [Anaerolineaceae bacterium]|nr:DUF177 domain-containing protein [Anaerolineaceae bacterium]
MRQDRFPLRANIGFILRLDYGDSRDFDFEFSRIILSPELTLINFKGVATFVRTRQGILVQGDFEAWIDQDCVRCLEPFSYKLHTTFDELYAINEYNMTESELLVPADGLIDLAPLVREYLTMEIPIQPICDSDCKGLCKICGANLNLESCNHSNQSHLQN